MNTPDTNFDELFRKELENTPFPIDKIDEDVQRFFPLVLASFSLAQIGCDLKTYQSLVSAQEEQEYNLYNISFLLNGVGALSPMKMDLNPQEYGFLLTDNQQMSTEWNAMVRPIRDNLTKKLEAKAALHVPGNGKLVNPGLRRN